MARRLVERGVRFVQVYSGGGHNDENWDAHGDVSRTTAALRRDGPAHRGPADGPQASRLARRDAGDLDQRVRPHADGPEQQGPRPQPARLHDVDGRRRVKGGQVIGATDEFGYAAVENKVHVHDLHATILHLMGLDHTLLTYFHAGRNMRLTDVHGGVVKQLIA